MFDLVPVFVECESWLLHLEIIKGQLTQIRCVTPSEVRTVMQTVLDSPSTPRPDPMQCTELAMYCLSDVIVEQAQARRTESVDEPSPSIPASTSASASATFTHFEQLFDNVRAVIGAQSQFSPGQGSELPHGTFVGDTQSAALSSC